MGLAHHIESLLEVSIRGQRSPVAGEYGLVAGIGDRRLLKHRNRLGPLARQAQRRAVFERGGGIFRICAVTVPIGIQVAPRIGGLARLGLGAERTRHIGSVRGGNGLTPAEADRQRCG
jgi:hypothetical protein